MSLTYQQQDNLLLGDIIERNYFQHFLDESNLKNLNLSFFYNDNFNDYHIIPNYESKEKNNNFNSILNNWEKLLEWYKTNHFNTNILIHDDLLFNNIHQFKDIIEMFINSKVEYKSFVVYIDWHKQLNYSELISIIKTYQEKFPLQIVFNIAIDKVEDIIKYELETIGTIHILIPPGLKGEDLINCQKIINEKCYNITEYIEIDSDEWNYTNISEYLKYIYFLLESIDKPRQLFSGKTPISIIDRHVVDNTNCKKDCCFQNSLNILISDLSINLCHKFQYDDQVIGYFEPDENNTFKIKAKILPLVMLNTHLKRSSTPHCEKCPYVGICKGFCFARSYQKCYNPAIPIKESCDLKVAKYTFIFNYLIKKYDFEHIIEHSLCNSDIYKNYLKQILNNMKENQND